MFFLVHAMRIAHNNWYWHNYCYYYCYHYINKASAKKTNFKIQIRKKKITMSIHPSEIISAVIFMHTYSDFLKGF